MRSADVVGLADFASLKNRENCAAIVFHVQPVALLFAVTVDRKRFVIERICDHQRQEFFGELVWAVIVRRARDQSGKFVGAHIGENQKVRGRLGSGIGTAWPQRRVFAGEGVWREIAIDFIGGNVNEARYGEAASDLQQSESSSDVGLNCRAGSA